ncbi:uncharacterized protein FFB20_15931 [Fusarium fujikuroi]|nr:uncharacterized protein FFB20_15931 [Fusarium fujikuroi]
MSESLIYKKNYYKYN